MVELDDEHAVKWVRWRGNYCRCERTSTLLHFLSSVLEAQRFSLSTYCDNDDDSYGDGDDGDDGYDEDDVDNSDGDDEDHDED